LQTFYEPFTAEKISAKFMKFFRIVQVRVALVLLVTTC